MSLLGHKSVAEVLRRTLPQALPDFIRDRRWFAGKARKIGAAEIMDIVPVALDESIGYIVLAEVTYATGPSELYDIPLTLVAEESRSDDSSLGLKIHESGRSLEFRDAFLDTKFLALLLDAIADNRSFAGSNGELRAQARDSLSALWGPSTLKLAPVLHRGEQSNSSVFYGKKLILKVFRRLQSGVNPDLEIGAFLTEHTPFRNIARVAGSLEYARKGGDEMTLGILQAFVENGGDVWEFTLQKITDYCERAAASLNEDVAIRVAEMSILDLSERETPADTSNIIGDYLDWAKLLGQRTAELHLALASATGDEAFNPQPFTVADQREFAQAASHLLSSTFQLLRDQRNRLPPDICEKAEMVLGRENELRKRFQIFERSPISALKTRIHGDYHLGQILFTGADFVTIDFEGEPSRPLAERRKKRSPLQDVAGLLRSFDYAAHVPLLKHDLGSENSRERLHTLGKAVVYWQKWVSAAFLRKYREVAGEAAFIPKSRAEFELMLNTLLLDKVVYELAYELNNRPTWLRAPLGGLSQLIQYAA